MGEGRKRAVAKGVKFGPKFKLNHFQRQEALARLEAGESQVEVARTYGVDRATISRLQLPAVAALHWTHHERHCEARGSGRARGREMAQ